MANEGGRAGGPTARTERDIEVSGLRLHLSSLGEGSTLVVMHHSTGPFWTPFYEQLAQSFALLAPDMPGYGRSERPPSARSPRDLAIRCLQGLDALALDRIHLLGLGFGGWVAAEMATMRWRALTTLTLVGAAGIKPRSGFIHDPMMSGFADYARMGFSSDRRFDDIFGPEPAPELVDLWDYSREMTARVTWRPWMWSTTLPSLLAGLPVPTLVVWGDDDRIVPLDCGEQYAQILPCARLEVVPAAGHLTDVEQPEALAAVVTDFVNSEGS